MVTLPSYQLEYIAKIELNLYNDALQSDFLACLKAVVGGPAGPAMAGPLFLTCVHSFIHLRTFYRAMH